MRKNIRVNLHDYTELMTPTGYIVTYIKRRGNNGSNMLDGTRRDDIRATKAVVSMPCMPTNEELLQAFLADISEDEISLEYFDPKTKDYRAITAIPSEPSVKYRGEGTDENDYWTGLYVTFEEV